ncbi:conserved hypothetical protein [Trypanosoma brucei gambiense DAL972]|uniref:RNase III domain-containing protein n=1 Tax=Trypanosoma brucei gambiense (strain MHOM/CI/86/DAL972) TaxID=679716 RepID=C9ZJZ5_TRYB9|nr:LOW QUALITY PROTEIN: conserved hypothetical protein [Trypanosoma brucei gambiense DAL972]CBH09759.1 conserved hypothetical protein [Trypanosoma brucei gambiense DAL972]|eukprot:XP_011772052.1 LOW QUALITY PROTEIN: conserved hypothetical protein [Trypanosoma brucei gambiense DAL972]
MIFGEDIEPQDSVAVSCGSTNMVNNTPKEALVLQRRGRWVMKLAVALFLSGKDLQSEGELSIMHSEIWSYAALGNEAVRRGYVPLGTPVAGAQSVWKRKLGELWLEKGFEPCMIQLEPYFQQEFERLLAKGILKPQSGTEKDSNCSAVRPVDTPEPARLSSRNNGAVEEFAKPLASLYEASLRYLRSVGMKTTASTNGWVSAEELYSYLKDRKHSLIVKVPDDIVSECDVLPTTPARLLVVLSQLDLIGRLQFRWESKVDGKRDDERMSLGDEQEECSVSVRAAWAHKDSSLASKVVSDHPKMALEKALEIFSPCREIYDFVESVERWEATAKLHGREIPTFRPFLMLAVGDSIRARIPKDPVRRAAALLASKVTTKSAFLSVSRSFLGLHLQRPVCVVHSNIFEGGAMHLRQTAGHGQPPRGVLLLHLSDIVYNAISNVDTKRGALFVKSEILYCGDASSVRSEPIKSLCLETEEPKTCTEPPSTSALLFARLAEKSITFNVPAESPRVSSPTLANRILTLKRPTPTTNATEFLCGLRSLSHGMGNFAREAFFKKWIEDILALLRARNNRNGSDRSNSCRTPTEKVLSVTPDCVYTDFSLIIAGKQKKDNSRPPGLRSLSKELINGIAEGGCDPLYIKSKQEGTIVVYFQSTVSDERDVTEFFFSSPLLLLRSSYTVGDNEGKQTEEETSVANHRSALFLRVDKSSDSFAEGDTFRSLTVVELDREQKKVAEALRSDCNTEVTLRSVELCVDEWCLEVLVPLEKVVEECIFAPIKQCLYGRGNSESPFLLLSEADQAKLEQSLMEQLLLAVTPVKNEALEYLGDAVLDFVVAQEKLNSWTGGPIVDATCNASLAKCLFPQLRNYFEMKLGISNQKRQADMVEAIFGAVAMALWVIPRRKVLESSTDTTVTGSGGGETPAAGGLLPFAALLSVTKALMDALNITTQ